MEKVAFPLTRKTTHELLIGPTLSYVEVRHLIVSSFDSRTNGNVRGNKISLCILSSLYVAQFRLQPCLLRFNYYLQVFLALKDQVV